MHLDGGAGLRNLPAPFSEARKRPNTERPMKPAATTQPEPEGSSLRRNLLLFASYLALLLLIARAYV
jgi:hypothetical protein